MTAVASPPSFQPIARLAWNTGNGGSQGGLDAMSTEEVSRMFMPRNGAQRPGSSSSLSSQSSTASTITPQQPLHKGTVLGPSGGWDGTNARKKPMRGLWPASKAEAVSGLSTARSHSVKATGQPGSAAMSTMQQPSSVLPPQQAMSIQQQPQGAATQQQLQQQQQQLQQNGARVVAGGQGESNAVLYLVPMNGTFDRKTIGVPFFPDVLRIGRQTNAKTLPTPTNGYFDSKVLSRQHAEIWSDRAGKIWIRDVKSSNGTFVNGTRLSAENRDSEPHELREQDILELGIDIVSEDQKTVVHHKVSARVEHAGFFGNSTNVLDLNFGDIDPTSGGGMMAPSLPQNMVQGRGRSGSQGSVGSNGRMNGQPGAAQANAMGQRQHMNFWLTPITMEQIVRKLTTELKAAKQQTVDLQRTGEFFDALLAHGSLKEESKSPEQNGSPQINGVAPGKTDQKARFLDPPAPPPRQPLPEKPDGGKGNASEVASPVQPSLKRSETERPKSNPTSLSSPLKGDSPQQIITLVDALASARQEIDSQSVLVKDLQEMLQQERTARESAESRAQQLERERLERASDISASMNGEARSIAGEGTSLSKHADVEKKGVRGTMPSVGNGVSVNAVDDDYTIHDYGAPNNSGKAEESTERLKQRLELMVVEMNEMKQTMESYKRRMETAEEDSAASRKSLAEMVEKIRRDDVDRAAKKERKRTQKQQQKSNAPSLSTYMRGVISSPDQSSSKELGTASTVTRSSSNVLRDAGVHEGQPLGAKEIAALERVVSMALAQAKAHSSSSQATQHDRLVQSAPYASILGVVVLGMGVMAILNGWQKVER